MREAVARWASTQVLMYSAARVLSAAASFYLFALLAQMYPPAVTADCYFFLFIFGFLAAALRMAGNITAGVSALRSRTANLRSVRHANCTAFVCALVVAPFGALLLEPYAGNWWLLAGGLALMMFASADSDMPRALAGRAPGFPVAFAIGSCAAVGLLVMVPDKSKTLAIAAILTQWVPASILGARTLMRTSQRQIKASFQQLWKGKQPLAWVMAVALFDGLILNAPFFLGSTLPAAVRLDISVVIRVFSASLLFSPLILHWSNSSLLGGLADIARSSARNMYFFLQLGLSFSSAAAFMVAYTLISGSHVSLDQGLAVAALLGSYSLYATISRHHGNSYPAGHRATFYAVVLASFFALVCWLLPRLGVVHISMLQSAALILGAALLWQGKSGRPPRRS